MKGPTKMDQKIKNIPKRFIFIKSILAPAARNTRKMKISVKTFHIPDTGEICLTTP